MIGPATLPTPLRAGCPWGCTHSGVQVVASLGHKAACAAGRGAHPVLPPSHAGTPDTSPEPTQADTVSQNRHSHLARHA